MKPTIRKFTTGWCVTFGYHPRQMWLFGADAEERRKITERCVSTSLPLDSWSEAVAMLRTLYRERIIRR